MCVYIIEIVCNRECVVHSWQNSLLMANEA